MTARDFPEATTLKHLNMKGRRMVMRTNLKKRSFILVLVVLTAITFFALKSETQAANTWYYTIAVSSAGPIGGGAFIMLSGTSVPLAWYTCLSSQVSQQLATAYTAISLGRTVTVYLDLNTSIISGIFVNNP
jgi:hypothetical protein